MHHRLFEYTVYLIYSVMMNIRIYSFFGAIRDDTKYFNGRNLRKRFKIVKLRLNVRQGNTSVL